MWSRLFGFEDSANSKMCLKWKSAPQKKKLLQMAPTSTVQTLPTTVLGKRKTPATKSLVLHLSSPESTYTPLDSDLDPIASTSNINGPPILVNGSLIPFTTKRYRCTYEGCDKAYSKPTRLAEHERSHTGQVCNLLYIFSTEIYLFPI